MFAAVTFTTDWRMISAGYVAPGDKWDNTGGTDVCDFGRSRRTGVMSMCTSRRRTRVGPYFGRVSSC
jgi:hypothetical protein